MPAMNYKRQQWHRAANIPLRFDKPLSDLGEIDPAVGKPVMRWLGAALAGKLREPGPWCGKGLLLHGPPGTGKTTLACSLLLELLIRADPSTVWGHGELSDSRKDRVVYFTEYAELLERRKRMWSLPPDSAEYARMLRDDQSVSGDAGWRWDATILVLDDLGKEHATKSRWAEDAFDGLLRHRFNLAYPTIITTNVPPEEWGQVYNQSMGSFASEAMVAVPMVGADRRTP